jgi:hypothetical protein
MKSHKQNLVFKYTKLGTNSELQRYQFQDAKDYCVTLKTNGCHFLSTHLSYNTAQSAKHVHTQSRVEVRSDKQ